MDSIGPVYDSCDERQGGKEISCEFIVAGGDCAEILEAAEGAFDNVSLSVERRIESKAELAIDLVGDDWRRAPALQEMAQMAGVIGLVAEQMLGRGRRGEQGSRTLDVGNLSAG